MSNPNSTCSPINDFCSDIVANPDISGIGVRVAIYAQTIISMLIASWLPYHEKAFRDTSRNCYIVSVSLILASMISWKTKGLSLFDGLIVTMLTTIMTAFVTVNGPYIRTLGLSINLSSFLFTTFWCYWGLQIWSDPSTFGLPGPACDASRSTNFVVFGHTVGATSRGLRGFAIFIFALGSISALFALWHTVSWLRLYTFGRASVEKENAAWRYAKEIRRKNKNRRPTRAQHITSYGGLMGMIYMIVTTEQIVSRNPKTRDNLNRWTYGQTLALIMLAQQLKDCFGYAKDVAMYNRQQRLLREELEQKRNRASV